jgi:ssDNA-binding Zn-finger/Zn-ribbon topoisomerase 1
MTGRELKTVLCPCCDKSLFQSKESEKGKAVFIVTDDSPRVLFDKEGAFIKCPYCSQRIAMDKEPAHPSIGYFVSPVQRCDQKLP